MGPDLVTMGLATAVFGSGLYPSHQPGAQKESLWKAGLTVDPERTKVFVALEAKVLDQSHLRRQGEKAVNCNALQRPANFRSRAERKWL